LDYISGSGVFWPELHWCLLSDWWSGISGHYSCLFPLSGFWSSEHYPCSEDSFRRGLNYGITFERHDWVINVLFKRQITV